MSSGYEYADCVRAIRLSDIVFLLLFWLCLAGADWNQESLNTSRVTRFGESFPQKSASNQYIRRWHPRGKHTEPPENKMQSAQYKEKDERDILNRGKKQLTV